MTLGQGPGGWAGPGFDQRGPVSPPYHLHPVPSSATQTTPRPQSDPGLRSRTQGAKDVAPDAFRPIEMTQLAAPPPPPRHQPQQMTARPGHRTQDPYAQPATMGGSC
eukprot:scaffold24515_cov112-Isochrysis_galbana.AAC.2